MRRYKSLDLGLFALLLCLLEAASAWATGAFPGEAYAFSAVLFVSLLMLARWGALGLMHAALGGAVFCFLHGAAPLQYAVYIVGNLAVAANHLWIRFLGVTRLRESPALTAVYAGSGYLAVCAGRAAVSGLLGQGFKLMAFFTAEALGAIVTVIAFLVARRQDGLFEPQGEYLLRVQEERIKGAR
jgi:hypothetical protein